MKPYVWKEGMSEQEMRDGSYWERNMLALFLAINENQVRDNYGFKPYCGWYIHGEWEGWSRVISLFGGQYTFHVPDDFDLGDLPQIEPDWDGHTTEEKWLKMMEECGCSIDDESDKVIEFKNGSKINTMPSTKTTRGKGWWSFDEEDTE